MSVELVDFYERAKQLVRLLYATRLLRILLSGRKESATHLATEIMARFYVMSRGWDLYRNKD